MSLRFIDGFSLYNTHDDLLKKWDYSNDNSNPIFTTGRTPGSTGLRFNENAAFLGKILDNQASWVIGFWFYLAAYPNIESQILRLIDGETVNTQVDVRVTTSGTLIVTRNGNSLTGTTTPTNISMNNWNYIEFKCTIGNSVSAGSCQLRLNGQTVFTIDNGQDTQNTANSYANIIEFHQLQGSVGTYYILGDVYMADGSSDFLGFVKVTTVMPAVNGSVTGFTGSDGNTVNNYGLVGEKPIDYSNYVKSSHAPTTDYYGFNQTIKMNKTIGQEIFGVQLNAALYKPNAGKAACHLLIHSGPTETTSDLIFIPNSYTYCMLPIENDPNTSAPWTLTNLDNSEIGIQNAIYVSLP